MTNKKLDIPIYLVSLEQDVTRREKLKKQFPETYSNFLKHTAISNTLKLWMVGFCLQKNTLTKRRVFIKSISVLCCQPN